MKRPFTAIMKNDEESAESTSTTAQVSNQAFLDDNTTTFLSSFNNNNDNDGTGSDSEDGLSDSSRKMRKKRNAYQKISDEIRVNLLDSVKNGETLKAAAKRYKINYSSAKSILHTYRKEGRILKKSAQERITKKKSSGGSETTKTQTKSSKSSKKENAVIDENNYTKTKTLETITKKVKVESYANKKGDEVQPLSQTNKNRANVPQNEYDQDNGKTNSHKNDEIASKMFGNTHDHEHQFMGSMNSRASSRKGSMHQFKLFDNIQMNYNDIAFPDFNQMMGDNYDFMTFRRFSQDLTSFGDMVHVLQAKPNLNEEHTTDPNSYFKTQNHHHHGDDQKHGKVENLIDGEDHGENGPSHMKGFMDSQRTFRNNLRKASFLSFGSNAGFRKGSFDLY
jgi:molybdenum-dependent DNA-binding transcriptional regulator ModE